jgi:hypothetical protein
VLNKKHLINPIINLVLKTNKHVNATSFLYIYKEFNAMADQLSKEATFMQDMSLAIQEFREGA